MMPDAPAPATPVQRLAAWAVHALTASGVVWALLAFEALYREAWREVLLWQLVALVVDGLDGTLARRARVAERVPRIDGAAMDLIVDYLNYVLVPTLLLWRIGALPAGWELALAIAIQLSSLYVFVRRDMKTEDGYFRGFPALWNVVAAYVLLLGLGPAPTAAIVLLFAALSFAPVLVIHPFRARDARVLGPVLASVWLAATAAVVLVPDDLAAMARVLSLGAMGALIALGLRRSMRGANSAS